jgi:hypothetical protein
MAIIAGVLAGLVACITKGMTISIKADGIFSWDLLYGAVVFFFAAL